jgi:uncharacterized protein YndB with AHSA1/START domain
MSVKKEASGRRSVQAEVELPGTPEQVWEAIATGPGISSWFCPTEVETGADGRPTRMVFHMGPGMDATPTITAWEPPRRFAAEDQGWAPGMPSIATEWTVEARAGGTCLVRVVHSMFASTDDWDNQLEGTETGWPGFFRILRLYLTHFRGQCCSSIQVMAMPAEPEAKAWETLTGSLGLVGATAGKRVSAPSGAPPLAGVVENASEGKNMHSMLIKLDEPGPGVVSISAFPCGGPTMVSVSFYLYGDGAAAVAKRDEPLWQAWMSKHFPAASGAGAGH